MPHSSLYVAAFLLAAVGLTACDAGPSHGSSLSPGPATKPGTAVSAPPRTVRSGHFTQVFDTPLPADGPSAEVVTGWRQAMVLWNDSEQKQSLTVPVTEYVTGDALRNLKNALSAMKKQNIVPAGGDRMFKTTVVSITGSDAEITTCDDGRKSTNMNLSTGVVDPPPDSVSAQYLFETWELTRGHGHWMIRSFNLVAPPAEAAQQCLP